MLVPMEALKRISVIVAIALGCFLVIIIGGFLLGAAGTAVTTAISMPALVGFIIFRRMGKYPLAALCFSLALAGGFALWLAEN